MRLVAIDLGDDIDVSKTVKDLGVKPPATWEDPIAVSHSLGEILLYSFGALVGINIPHSDITRIAKEFLKFTQNGSLGEVEEVVIEKGSGSEEIIGVEKLDELAIKVVSFALAQSVALSRMEKIMDEIEEEVEKVLFSKRRFSGKKALDVAKTLMKTRHELISDIMILEKPSLTWEEDRLDDLYEKVSKYLELGRRYRVMEKRLQSAFETVQVLLSFSSEARGNLLELLIVILIIIEILLWIVEIF